MTHRMNANGRNMTNPKSHPIDIYIVLCRRGGAHPMPWLRRGGRRGCAHPIPRLRRSAPKRHRRERTATEVAPPHSPYAAPRLTLHVSDVLEKVVCPAPYIFFIKYESCIRFASIII